MKCDKCNGQGEYMPLGHIIKTCPDCNGLKIKSKERHQEEKIIAEPTISDKLKEAASEIVQKKRGRPKSSN